MPIVLFLVFGAFFGLATYSNRHLFSEGPRRRDDDGERDPLDGRLMWVAICTCLWPLLAMTGLYAAWRRARAHVHARRDDRR
jgi:hypothetical protein